MKLLRRDSEGSIWHLRSRERDLLLLLFSRHPAAGRQATRISFTSEDLDRRVTGDLSSHLDEHRAAARGNVLRWLTDATVCVRGKGGFALTLSPGGLEELLQALNDIRLGAWERLGRPNPPDVPDDLAPESPALAEWWLLDLASGFQGRILEALEHD
jgi:hypothetical protein